MSCHTTAMSIGNGFLYGGVVIDIGYLIPERISVLPVHAELS